MAISFKKQYLSEADFAYDLASSTNKLFNSNDYKALAQAGLGVDYAYLLADMVGKTSDTFDLSGYNLLTDPIDKLTYITTHYYTPKDTTATDEKTGEVYNVFERNDAYLQHKIQQQMDKNTYDSLNFFEKAASSIVGFVGNTFSQAWSLVENLIDLGAFIGESGARLFGDTEAAEGIRAFAERDFTGSKALQNTIDRFNAQYTVWDKTAITKAVLEIQSSIVRMAPLALNVVAPGAGSMLYYGAMAGQSYSDVLTTNPDVSYGNLLAYIAGSVAIEAGTELASAKIFGGDTMSRWIFGGKGEVRTAFKSLGMDMFTEGLEEGVAELFGGLLYKATIDKNAQAVSFEDILYASVLGALTGGIMTGGSILTTGRFGVTKDGQLMSVKQAQKDGVSLEKNLNKLQSYNIRSALNAQLQTVSEVQKLNNKYMSKSTTEEQLREIQKEHAIEYEQARKIDNENAQKATADAVKIARFLETIGLEKFKTASKLLEDHLEDAVALVENWQNHQRGVNKFQQTALAELEAANPGVTININETLTGDEKALAKALKEAYGVDLIVGKWASENGQTAFGDLKTTKNYIFLENGSLASRGYQNILDEVISKQLVSVVLNTPGLLTDKNIQKLLNVIAKDLKTSGEITNDVKSDIASMLLFDDITINKVFYSDSNLFVKMARWVKNAISKNRTQKKTDANKIEFNKLLKIRQRYINSVAKSIGNKEDVSQATKTMDLSAEEANTILNQMQRNVTNHILLFNNDLTTRSVEFKTAQLKLISSKADGNVDTDIDFSRIYDTAYWTEAFVKEVTTFYPDYSFEDALDYYCMDKLGFVLSQRNQTMYKVANLAESEEVSKKEFLIDVEDAMVTNDIRHIQKYTKPADIFSEKFLSAFAKEDLNKITIKYDQLANKQGQTFIEDDGSITITINASAVMSAQKIIYHEMAHAFGKILGFSNGTSKKAMIAVANTLSDIRLRQLAIKMFGSDFANTATRQELVSEVASELYSQNEGERYANGDPTKFTRDFDGFRVYNGYVFGLGKYEFVAPGMRLMLRIPEGVEPNVATLESKFSEETGITIDNAKTLGFSEDFISLLEEDAITKGSLWAMIDVGSIGTPEATNKIISWLVPENKSMKTIEDVEKAKTLGLAYAAVYGKLRKNKDPEYSEKKRHSFEKLNEYFNNHPEHAETAFKTNEKLVEPLLKSKNVSINSWLLKKDYGYSIDMTNKAFAVLRGEYGTQGKSAVKVESLDVETEEGEISAADKAAMAEWENSQDDSAQEIIDNYPTVDEYIASAKEILNKLGNDSKSAETVLDNIRRPDQAKLLKSAFGDEGYLKITKTFPNKHVYKERIRERKKALAKYENQLSAEEKTLIQQNHLEIDALSKLAEYSEKLQKIKEKYSKKSAEEAILSKSDEGKVVEKKDEIDQLLEQKATKEEINEVFVNSDGSKKVFYKGADVEGIKEFDNTKGSKLRVVAGANWFTDSREAASSYVNPQNEKGTIYSVTLSVKNPLIVDGKNGVFGTARGKLMTDDIVRRAFEKGFDAVVFKNIRDFGPHLPVRQTVTSIAVKGSDNITILSEDKNITRYEKKQQVKEIEDVEQYDNMTKEEHKNFHEQVKAETKPVTQLTVSEDVSNKKNKLLELMPEEVRSQYRGDYNNPKYVKAERKTIDNNLEFFNTITSDEYQTLIQLLAMDFSEPSLAALVLLQRWAYENRAILYSDIRHLILDNNKKLISLGGRLLGGASADYGSHGNVKTFLNELSMTNKQEVKLSEDLASKILKLATNKNNVSLNDYQKQITDEIDALRNERKKTNDPFTRFEIQQEINNKTRLLDALMDNDYAALVDEMISDLREKETSQSENEDKIREIYNLVLEYILDRVDNKTNKVGTGKRNAPLSEKTANFLRGLNSFRYLAMLSSPKTWIKNQVSNTGVGALALVEDVVSSTLSKFIRIDSESQIAFSGDYDEEFKNYVKETYAPIINKKTEGDKYIQTELDDLKNKYAKENDPLNKIKLLSRIKEFEQKALNDKPWTSRRALRNLTNTLAGSCAQILAQCDRELTRMYAKNISRSEVTQEKLLLLIEAKNKELSALYERAINGNKTAVVQLGEKLGVELLNKDNPDNIINYSLYRANKLFFKVDNWWTNTRKTLSVKHPNAVLLVDFMLPFLRTTVNTSGYFIDRTPVGIAKGVMKIMQTKKSMVSDMRQIVLNHYERVFNEQMGKIKEDHKFKRDEFNAWADKNIPEKTLKALNGDNKLMKDVYDDMIKNETISPGGVGESNPYLRAVAIEQLSQGLTGTALIALGMVLAAVLDGLFDYEDDDDYMGAIIRIGDLKIALNDLSPFSTMFTVGAMLGSNKIDDNAGAALSVIADSTLFSVMDSAISYSNNVWEYFENQSIQTIQQFIPSILKNITKVVDNSKKDKSGSWGEKLLKTTAANTPFLSWLVPNKINPYTGEKEAYFDRGWFDGVLNIFAPMGYRYDVKSDFQKEAEKRHAESSGLSGRFTINGKDVVVTGTTKEKLAKYRADYINNEYARIVSGKQTVTVEGKDGKRITTTYNKLTTEQKTNVIKNLYTKASEVVKIKYWLDQGNYYIVTDRDKYSQYKNLLKSTRIIYKKSWSKSKFVEK